MWLISELVFYSLPFVFVVFYVFINRMIANKKSVCIVVLGDIGRSPRMQYHAMSFAKTSFTVDLVGYKGSELQPELRDNERVTVHHVRETPRFLQVLPRMLVYLVKVVWLSIGLLLTLLLMPKCGFILLQNPPCIPTMFVAQLACLLRGGEVVIDWHNYGYTIMSMTMAPGHPLVRFAKWYERFFARYASSNICVTKAMQTDLKENWNVGASVMYDRPPVMFQEADLDLRHDLYLRLGKQYPAFNPREVTDESSTAFTTVGSGGEVRYLEKRPAVVVSSTSWTEDEDFSILLSALEIYEKKLERTDLPDIVCIITGKGPQKEHYKGVIESQTWNHVTFCLPWLTPEDYPRMLGSADIGVCLHMSSSGLDLPMKVVDMFGCGLPVCAVNFNCLHELVKQDTNGLVFEDSKGLAENIETLLQGFPNNNKKLKQFRKNLSDFQSHRWHENWSQTVLPLFTESKKDR